MDNRYFIYSIIFLGLAGCSQGSNENQEPKDSVAGSVEIFKEKEAVKATLVAMWDAVEKGDIDRYATYVHPDFTQFGEYDSALRIGKEAEVEGMRGSMQRSTEVHTEMIDPRVTVTGDVAWVVYYWSDSGLSKGEPFATHGKSTRIFVKENGNWLCIHGHYTLLPVE